MASSARAVSSEPRQAEEVVQDAADGGHGRGQVAGAEEQVSARRPGSELELFTGGMPRSHFDFDFDLLHDVLYQDKDYEVAYLGNRSIAKPGDLEEWFEDFQTPAPRDPGRGFRR